MAVYDLEEQEKIEDLKAWWAQYGKYVSAVVTAIAIVVIGVQGWRWYQRTQAEQALTNGAKVILLVDLDPGSGKSIISLAHSRGAKVIGVWGWRWYQRTQAEQASVLYQAVSDAARAQDVAKAKDPATQIVQRYAGTAYAPRAALLYAKLLYDKDDKAGAKQQLQWVVDHAGEDELKAIARFRLAQALLDEKNYDEALKTIDVRTDDAFVAIYADLRGDILASAGKKAEARAAYQIALAKMDPKSQYRPYVQVKLDSLGGAQ